MSAIAHLGSDALARKQARKDTPISLEKVFHLGLGEPPETARERAQEIEYFEKVIA